eukprot:Clim_evm22s88 gene=Clim_evmTU22s88
MKAVGRKMLRRARTQRYSASSDGQRGHSRRSSDAEQQEQEDSKQMQSLQVYNLGQLKQLTLLVRDFSAASKDLSCMLVQRRDEGEDFEDGEVSATLGKMLEAIRQTKLNFKMSYADQIVGKSKSLVDEIRSLMADEDRPVDDALNKLQALDTIYNGAVSRLMTDDGSVTGSLEDLFGEDDEDDFGRYSKSASSFSMDAQGFESMENVPLSGGQSNGTIQANADDHLPWEDEVDIILDRGKEWSAFTREMVGYIDKRAELERAHAINLEKLAQSTSASLLEGGWLKRERFRDVFQTTVAMHAAMARTHAGLINAKMQQEMDVLRQTKVDFDRQRKVVAQQYKDSERTYRDSVSVMKKTRERYRTLNDTWENALLERMKEEGSTYKLKLQKRQKEEEEAKNRVDKSRDDYVQSVTNSNHSQEEFITAASDLSEQLRDWSLQSDESLKAAMVAFLQMEADAASTRNQLMTNNLTKAEELNYSLDFKHLLKTHSCGRKLQYVPHVIHDYGADTAAQTEQPTAAAKEGTAAASKIRLHKFQKLSRPSKCRHCENFVYLNGVECSICRLAYHKKCVNKLDTECAGKVVDTGNQSLSLFGTPLSDSPQRNGLPFVIDKCIAEIEARDLDEEGLYRLAGVKSRIERACALMEKQGARCDLGQESDVHVITNMLKLYMRQLPEPVVPTSMYDDMLILTKKRSDATVQDYRDFLTRLPPVHYATLKALIKHLNLVTSHCESNKMKASNLGIVFGPTLLRPENEDDQLQQVTDMPHQSFFVERLISNADEVFCNDAAPDALAADNDADSIVDAEADNEEHTEEQTEADTEADTDTPTETSTKMADPEPPKEPRMPPVENRSSIEKRDVASLDDADSSEPSVADIMVEFVSSRSNMQELDEDSVVSEPVPLKSSKGSQEKLEMMPPPPPPIEDNDPVVPEPIMDKGPAIPPPIEDDDPALPPPIEDNDPVISVGCVMPPPPPPLTDTEGRGEWRR